jgi:hypothetical protein
MFQQFMTSKDTKIGHSDYCVPHVLESKHMLEVKRTLMAIATEKNVPSMTVNNM